MSMKIAVTYQPGRTIYCVLFDQNGRVLDTETGEWYDNPDLSDPYDPYGSCVLRATVAISCLEFCSFGVYLSEINPISGTYYLVAYEQIDEIPDDNDIDIGSTIVYWSREADKETTVSTLQAQGVNTLGTLYAKDAGGLTPFQDTMLRSIFSSKTNNRPTGRAR